jgi:hypothetical protein
MIKGLIHVTYMNKSYNAKPMRRQQLTTAGVSLVTVTKHILESASLSLEIF